MNCGLPHRGGTPLRGWDCQNWGVWVEAIEDGLLTPGDGYISDGKLYVNSMLLQVQI